MNWFKPKRIFLDYASATSVLPEVKKEMEKYWSEDFYNPSAIYKEGLRVKDKITSYRRRTAELLGISADGVVFTSGGTESDNLAILGAFEAFRQAQGKKASNERPHIIISAIEHPAVVAAAEEVVRRGGELSTCQVDLFGTVSLEELKKLLRPNTFLVSIGLANSEIGTVQPISKIGQIIHAYRKEHSSVYPYLHTDASQAPSFLNVNLESLKVDLLTLDGAKIYGPKGVGVLAMKKGIKIHPIIFGGLQEGGRRAGTLNPALIAGFTVAFEVASRDREKESKRLESMRKYFVETIVENNPKLTINGSEKSHLPNIVSVSVPGALAEFVLLKLDRAGVLVSVGSACSLDEMTSGSPVIKAIGKEDLSESTLRFSFGRFTTPDDIKQTAKIFCQVIGK